MVTEPRQAKQSRPQLVVVLADDSGSMRGEKAGVATDGSTDDVDEDTLKQIASQEGCYIRASDLETLTTFISRVGSCGASSAAEVARVVQNV